MLQNATLVIFPAMMVFSAISDVLTMTIPNRVSVILVLSFLALAVVLPMPVATVAMHVTSGATVLLLTFALFQLGWIGGGDAKLASATALWLGWENLLDYGVLASIAGGALTVFIVSMRWSQLPERLLSIGFIARLAEKSNGVPYGVALAVAGLLIYPQTGVWRSLAGI